MNEELYLKIKYEMLKRGLNQTSLGKELGVSNQYVSQVLTGKYKNPKLLQRIEEILEITKKSPEMDDQKKV